MENRIIIYELPVDPVTHEVSETEMFKYRGRLLHWGVRTTVDHDYGIAIVNTVAIVEPLDSDKDGLYPVMSLLPDEISFE
jgi:hypothetical protein